jgi:hypothetical protein
LSRASTSKLAWLFQALKLILGYALKRTFLIGIGTYSMRPSNAIICPVFRMSTRKFLYNFHLVDILRHFNPSILTVGEQIAVAHGFVLETIDFNGF